MIHILLPVHSRIAITRRFVDCLARQTRTDFRLILIDDGSTDGTSDMVLDRIPGAVAIRGAGDWWWGGSLHQGFLLLDSASLPDEDLVLTMNDDTTFAPDFLENVHRAMSGKQRTLLVAVARDAEGNVLQRGMKVDWLRLRFRQSQAGEVNDWAPTRGLCMRMKDFHEIGGFYPRLLPHYLSDVEYTLRARRKGFAIECDENVCLSMDPEATGEHAIKAVSLGNYLRRLFSKRTSHNPVYMTIFVILAAPWWAVPIGIAKSWLLPIVEIMGWRRVST